MFVGVSRASRLKKKMRGGASGANFHLKGADFFTQIWRIFMFASQEKKNFLSALKCIFKSFSFLN